MESHYLLHEIVQPLFEPSRGVSNTGNEHTYSNGQPQPREKNTPQLWADPQ